MAHAPLKRQRANSLVHALRLCKEWAQAKRHLSVERIADRMGTTHDSLYKWLATGRMPAILIPIGSAAWAGDGAAVGAAAADAAGAAVGAAPVPGMPAVQPGIRQTARASANTFFPR